MQAAFNTEHFKHRIEKIWIAHHMIERVENDKKRKIFFNLAQNNEHWFWLIEEAAERRLPTNHTNILNKKRSRAIH